MTQPRRQRDETTRRPAAGQRARNESDSTSVSQLECAVSVSQLRLDARGGTLLAHAEANTRFLMGELVTQSDLQAAMDTLPLRLTLRLGVMLVIGLGILAAILKLWGLQA